MKTIEERLNEELNTKDEEISNLNAIIRTLRQRLEGAETGWCMAYADERPDTKNYPIPRLEITWAASEQFGWSSYRTEYRLVYRHLADDVVIVPFAYTKHQASLGKSPFEQSCARPEEPFLPEMPFRMGCEASHDAHHLQLPLYLVLPDRYLRIDDHPFYATQQRLGREHRKSP